MKSHDRPPRTLLSWSLLVGVAVSLLSTSHADEGMWTYYDPPLEVWKERHGFEPTQQWLDHLRLSSVRFGRGGSGSFVSVDGLVLTNHHVARSQLEKLSTPKRDIATDGFHAATRDEELPCPDTEVRVLRSMVDVTERVHGASSAGAGDREASEVRTAEIARIEEESLREHGLHSEVVSFHEGAEYWLYRFQVFEDVRLVFAPEQQAAFFGGDLDNFTFPRHDLDLTILRVWQDGEPYHPEHYLRWSEKGAGQGELAIVSGHPAGTDRQHTVAQLEYQRDHYLPMVKREVEYRLLAMRDYAERGAEEARRVQGRITGHENWHKVVAGQLRGLRDRELMARQVAAEEALIARVAADAALAAAYAGAWREVEAIQQQLVLEGPRHRYRDLSRTLLGRAISIVQLVAEAEKPNEARLDEYHESKLGNLKTTLFSPAPVYLDLEEILLAATLEVAGAELGDGDPFMAMVLKGRTAAKAAAELVRGTRLGDPAFRRALVEGGSAAVEASTDPMIALARELDQDLRAHRRRYDEEIENPLTEAGTKLAQARFRVYGRSVPPDANRTLRLSFGLVVGYPEGSTLVPYKTTYHGLFDRAESFDDRPPFRLPTKVRENRDAIDANTPLNFVCTADIIGGNSGSPVVNRAGEVIGLVFDGNLHSLSARYHHDEASHRAVSVHSEGILEALRKVYDAEGLADELEGK